MTKNEKPEPIPLADPDGSIRAWACEYCFRVAMNMSCGGPNGRFEEADYSRKAAEGCCRCRICKHYLSADLHKYVCDDCRAKEQEAQSARDEERQPEREAFEAEQKSALSKSTDRDAALRLFEFMSDTSEECYCAGWMMGNEFSLWAMHEGGKRDYGMGEVSESDVAELRRLSAKCGGWWRWVDDKGEMFTPMDEWKVLVEASK